MSAGLTLLFIVKIHHLNQIVIKKDLLIILKQVEILQALNPKEESKIEELLRSKVNALLTFVQKDLQHQEHFKNHI